MNAIRALWSFLQELAQAILRWLLRQQQTATDEARLRLQDESSRLSTKLIGYQEWLRTNRYGMDDMEMAEVAHKRNLIAERLVDLQRQLAELRAGSTLHNP